MVSFNRFLGKNIPEVLSYDVDITDELNRM